MENERKQKKIVRVKAVVKKEKLPIRTEVIRLDAALKFAGCAPTGGEAKLLIENGEVRVDGEVCTQRGRKLRPGAVFSVGGAVYEIVPEEPAPC